MQTVAERSKYTRTSTHKEVQAFCDALRQASPLVHLESIGQSGEGQELTALIVSDRKCFTPQLAAKQKKVVVLVEANIHAGEVEGKEASLALVRDLVGSAEGKRLFAKICLVLVPNFNPDGNDRISPKNRALNLAALEGQVNPEHGVGMRYTGEGWNLNRDSMKQEAPETRAMARLYQRFWPHLFIDCHTTDGSLHRYDLTFDIPRGNEPLFQPARAYNRFLVEEVAKNVKQRHGFSSQWYGNFVIEDQPESGWHTYPALPRFGSHYRGLQGRLDVLLETYSYISYKKRCDTTRAWLLELLRFAAKHDKTIVKTLAAQERVTVSRGEHPDPRNTVAIGHGVRKRDEKGALTFDYPAFSLDGDSLNILSFDRPSLAARKYPGKKATTYKVPHLRGFVPTASARLPFAYLVPSDLASRLDGHGISYRRLDAQRLAVESYRVEAIERTHSPDVAAAVPPLGQAEVPLSQKPPPTRFETVLTVTAERNEIEAGGMLFVPSAQRSGVLAAYLLEPCADDGFARWQLLDKSLKVGAHYPIHRVLAHVTPRVRPE